MSFYYNDNNGMYPRFLAEDNFSNATDDFLTSEEVHEEDHIEPRTAMLFPWFFQLVGIFAFFFLSRYLRALPYTAVLFLLGMCAGIGVKTADNDNLMHDSIRQWTGINGELLLNVFLPGLVFKDAVSLNFHLFNKSLYQLLLLAFPAVLGGAFLTALVAYHIFPYDWSFSLAMTFGAILSATDPVAVSALLNEVGAPPRMKTHISGESLLNDGSAIVFYVIFSQRYLFELGIEGFGQDFDAGEGFALFFRESLGGAAMGIAFGLGLVGILYTLNRRFEEEENVVQVAASITTAYLCFYSADINRMSGVMAVVLCGITTRAVGPAMINDWELWENFWNIIEHLLNSLLFPLGGTVWGTIIAPSDSRKEDFAGKDWGYLVVLYLLLNVIRFVLLFGFYPITSRIGLKGDIKETFFSAFGGLRGAIGIALALSLDAEVREYTEMFNTGYEFREETNKLFGMVGGIALLTLVINGSLAGPLLRKLGLADSTDDRKRVVDGVHRRGVRRIHVSMMRLLTEPRFRNVDFASVRYHIHSLKDFTLEDLRVAMKAHKECTPPREYKVPYLKKLLPYLLKEGQKMDDVDWLKQYAYNTCEPSTSFLEKPVEEELTPCDTKRLLELRQAFLTLLLATYNKQVDDGELDGRVGFVAVNLEQALEFAADRVAKGEPLQDWYYSGKLTNKVENHVIAQYDKIATKFSRGSKKNEHVSVAHIELRMEIHKAASFIKAHRHCQEIFRIQLCEGDGEYSYVERTVLHESQIQVKAAEDFLLSFDPAEVDAELSHLFAINLLNKSESYIRQLTASGVLTQREAGAYSEEIEEELDVLLRYCPNQSHPGQLSSDDIDRAFCSGEKSEAPAEGPEDTA